MPIRHSVFETNSSSTHSISIGNQELDDTLIIQDGICLVYPGEFGWEWRKYTDATTKASYCLTHLKSIKEYKKEITDEEIQKRETILKEVIQERVNAPVEFCQRSIIDEYYKWGYIDHQSIEDGGAGEQVWESKETLSKFIFSKSSKLTTGNDNEYPNYDEE